MIRKSDDFVLRPNARGGRGAIEMHTLLTPEECDGKVTACNRIVLPPQSSIGYHAHLEDVEYYCILKGKGVFYGADGCAVDAVEGDVCLIRRGESHGLENNSDEPLEILAIIVE